MKQRSRKQQLQQRKSDPSVCSVCGKKAEQVCARCGNCICSTHGEERSGIFTGRSQQLCGHCAQIIAVTLSPR